MLFSPKNPIFVYTNKYKTMTRTIYSTNLADVVTEIKAYINQTQSADERKAYNNELNETQHNFLKLIRTGVFHDACGKLVGVRGHFNVVEAYVSTSY